MVCDDAHITELNREWRGVDGPTDVLSFELEDDEDETGCKPEVRCWQPRHRLLWSRGPRPPLAARRLWLVNPLVSSASLSGTAQLCSGNLQRDV